jgi:hypothetical protein
MRTFLVVFLALCATTFAKDITPPVPAVIPLLEGGEVRGKIGSFDAETCQVMVGAATEPRVVRWDAVQPRAVLALHERLLGSTGTAQEWLDVGRLLHHAPGGGPALSARPFARALKLDPLIRGEIENAKASPKDGDATTAPSENRGRFTLLDSEGNPMPASQPTAGATTRPTGRRGENWGTESDEELARATADAKRHAEKLHALSTARLELLETRYFLFYSNLPQAEAKKWSDVLDRMYGRLAHMFALEPKDRNLWHGKAIITVFLSRDDFLKFEKAAYQNDRAQNSGFCHQASDGRVHVVFYRSPDDLTFAQLLVHESTHGFLHRYRSPKRIPSWANEGLAEVMEFELVPHAGLKMASDARAKSELRRPQPLKDLFADKFIENFQYPIVRTLSEFMIQQNQKGYVEFINGVKDGMRWEDALAQQYGVPLEKLIPAYGASMGVPGLKP